MTHNNSKRNTAMSVAVPETLRQKFRVQAAKMGITPSQFIYELLKIVTEDFTIFNLNDIRKRYSKLKELENDNTTNLPNHP